MIELRCRSCRRILFGYDAKKASCRRRLGHATSGRAAAKLTSFKEADIEVLESIGELDSFSKSSTPKQDAAEALQSVAQTIGLEALGVQGLHEEQPSAIKVQLYRGRIKRGAYSNTDVNLKAYPQAQGSETDLLVTNEVAAHSSLQLLPGASPVKGSANITQLLGTVDDAPGGQTLVFRRDTALTSEAYCQQSAEELFDESQQADENFWQQIENHALLDSRKTFIKRVMAQLLEGLDFAHKRSRVHRRLVPNNILLSGGHFTPPESLLVQLQNFSLAADISDSALIGGATLAEIWQHNKVENEDPLKRLSEPIWEQARMAGATGAQDKRVFAISEDIFAAGLLLAYLCLAPFCAPGSIDFTTVQRLFGVTFQSELGAAREYCEADERWQLGVAFLNEDIGSGWDLIQSMVFPDYKLRPTAESCLNHSFLSAARQKT